MFPLSVSSEAAFGGFATNTKKLSATQDTFAVEIWGKCCLAMSGKGVSGNFFSASFNSYVYFSKRNACFVTFQTFYARQKQTSRLIKLSRGGFL